MDWVRRHWWWVFPLVLVAAAVGVYWPVMVGGGFFWDDSILLTDNALVKGGWEGLRDIWVSTKNPDYFPLTSTSFWLEWRAWGMWSQPYHVTNVVLHFCSGVLLWRIFLRLRVAGAAVMALLFVIHPVNVESVSWIAERKNTLSMVCLCASLLLYLRWVDGEGRREVSLWGSVGLFVLSLLAKTSAVMFPLVLLVIAWYRTGRIGVKDVARAVPYFCASAVLAGVTIYFQSHNAISDVVVRNDSMASRLATASCAVWFYAWKDIVPLGLMFNYPRWEVMRAGAVAWVPLVGLAAAAGTMWGLRNRIGRGALAGALAFLFLLAPMLGFLNIFFMRYSLVSDHWQYHAMAAVIAVVVGSLAWGIERLSEKGVSGGVGVAVAIAVALGVESRGLAADYTATATTWAAVVRDNPRSWLGYSNLGMIRLEEAKRDPAAMQRAIDAFANVVEIEPRETVGYTNLGNAYVRAGRLEEAVETYGRGVHAERGSRNERAWLHVDLGMALARHGDIREAQVEVGRGLGIAPGVAGEIGPQLKALREAR